ncbi:MAG: hypothetical protein E6G66_18890, partial [Actinobacteria bacterium]
MAFALGAWLAELPTAVLGHLVFAFPSGRVESRAERAFVGASYGAIIGLSGLRTLAVHPVFQRGCGGGTGSHLRRCTSNAALLFRSPAASAILSGLHDVILAGITLVGLGLLVRRWLRATPPARRTLAPVVAVGAVLACLFIAVSVTNVSEASLRVQHGVYAAAQVGILVLPFAFLAGLLQSRLAQIAVSRLVVELGETPPPGKLQGALAAALGDPGVQLAYWWPDREAFVDLDGKLVELSDLPPGLTPTILERGGERVGAL